MHGRRHLIRTRALPITLALTLASVASARSLDAQAHPPVGPLLTPWEIRVTWRTGAPDARADGAAWTALGPTIHLRGSHTWRCRGFVVRIAPELTATANGTFDLPPARDPARNRFASPLYAGAYSIDLPERFGEHRQVLLHPGESGVWWSRGALSVGATTALPAWGPPEGEGLVLGASAPGFPRLEAAHGFRVAGRPATVRWMAGEVRGSAHFAPDAPGGRRIVAGARIEVRPPNDGLTVGLTRTVMDAHRASSPARRALAPFERTRGDTAIDFLSLDFAYSSSPSGTTAWLEMARQERLGRARDLALNPARGIAFRVGVRQRVVTTARSRWAVATEFVRLDQAPLQDLYTSPTVDHGWTHRGQPLGSGLGPGGQRQYIAADREGAVWRTGAFLERTRRHDDALYREAEPADDRHDVTLMAGLRAGRRWRDLELDGHLAFGRRWAHLLRGPGVTPDGRAVDIGVLQLGLVIRPAH